jgi:DNA-binding transcriptional ArsR family regulator
VTARSLAVIAVLWITQIAKTLCKITLQSPSLGDMSQVVLDARMLRTLAHPMRIRIVGLLRQFGPATATQLGHRLSVSSGVTSYHLRELAKAGLVAEDETRGNARDRWWRAAHDNTVLDDVSMLTSEPDSTLGYLRGVAQINAEAIFRYLDELPTLPKNWQEAATISDYLLHLAPSQLESLLKEFGALLAKYRAEPRAPGARPVAVQIQAFPMEGR